MTPELKLVLKAAEANAHTEEGHGNHDEARLIRLATEKVKQAYKKP